MPNYLDNLKDYFYSFIRKFNNYYGDPGDPAIKGSFWDAEKWEALKNMSEEEINALSKSFFDEEKVEKCVEFYPNLKKLVLERIDDIGDDKIQNVIDRFPDLESLTIKGIPCACVLDVSKLSNLKELKVISNKTLLEIKGIETLNKLESFTFYDNIRYGHDDDVTRFVSKKSHDKKIRLQIDVNLYRQLKDHNCDMRNIFFSESCSCAWRNEELLYHGAAALHNFEKAEEVINKYIKSYDSTEEQNAIISQWLEENVVYAFGKLDVERERTKQKRVPDEYIDRIHGALQGFDTMDALCEGYSKMAQLLHSMCGNKLYEIGCFTKDYEPVGKKDAFGRDFINNGNHSLQLFDLDGFGVYSDITVDAQAFQLGLARQNFMLNHYDIMMSTNQIYADGPRLMDGGFSREHAKELQAFAINRIYEQNKKDNPRLYEEYEKMIPLHKNNLNYLMNFEDPAVKYELEQKTKEFRREGLIDNPSTKEELLFNIENRMMALLSNYSGSYMIKHPRSRARYYQAMDRQIIFDDLYKYQKHYGDLNKDKDEEKLRDMKDIFTECVDDFSAKHPYLIELTTFKNEMHNIEKYLNVAMNQKIRMNKMNDYEKE